MKLRRHLIEWWQSLVPPAWPEQPLAPLILRQKARLDTLFGPDGYEVVPVDDNVVQILSDKATIVMYYNLRDRWVESRLLPGKIDPNDPYVDLYGSWQWRECLGLEPSERVRAPLNESMVKAELDLLEEVLLLFEDCAATAKAFDYIQVRHIEYNEWLSGELDDHADFRPPEEPIQV